MSDTAVVADQPATNEPASESGPVVMPRRARLGDGPLLTPARVGALVVIAAGIAMRVFILRHSLGVLDSDEATTGLVARHFLHNHEHPVFYWSSNYGGTIEAAATAVMFAVFGSSVAILKITAVLWYGAACVLAWRVGAHLVDERAGTVAALVMWVWPAPYVWWSTKSRGFYGSVLFLALLMALMALRATERPTRKVEWLVFGLAFGLGWWDTPQIMLLAVPIGLWVLMRNWRALTWAWLAVPAAVVGAFPWLLWNIRHSLDSFNQPPQVDTYTGLVSRFGREALPVALGLRVPYVLRWLVPEGNRVYVLACLVAAVLLAWMTWRYHRRGAALLAVAFAVYPFLYALNRLAFTTSEARYVFMLSPIIAFTIGFCARPRWAAAGVVAAAGVLSVLGLTTMHDGNSPIPYDRPVPLSVKPLIRAMRAEGVTTAYATYWIAYRVDFESNEKVTVAGSDYNRYPPYGDKVRASAAPAWIVLANTSVDGRLKQALDAMGEPYRVRTAGGFAIYLPAHHFDPGQLPNY